MTSGLESVYNTLTLIEGADIWERVSNGNGKDDLALVNVKNVIFLFYRGSDGELRVMLFPSARIDEAERVFKRRKRLLEKNYHSKR